MKSETAEKIVDLGKLILEFGKIDRITLNEDGTTPESDTDHTVMLAVVACAVASEYKKDLDLGLVAQFALVHDLVEVYAGDTPNIGGRMTTNKIKEDKIRLEKKALERIEREYLDVLPWLPSMIRKYEKLDTLEARFVKVLDKVVPKITHRLNGAIALKNNGYTKEKAEEMFNEQMEKIESTYGRDQKEALQLYRFLADKTLDTF